MESLGICIIKDDLIINSGKFENPNTSPSGLPLGSTMIVWSLLYYTDMITVKWI